MFAIYVQNLTRNVITLAGFLMGVIMEWWQVTLLVVLVVSIVSGLYRYVDKMREGLQKKIDNLYAYVSESNDVRERAINHLTKEIERLETEIHRSKLK